MKKISLVYISLSGNTESFVTRLKTYLLEQYKNIEIEKIDIKELVKEGQGFYEMSNPFVDARFYRKQELRILHS